MVHKSRAMARAKVVVAWAFIAVLSTASTVAEAAIDSIGVNWGAMASHPMLPKTVVNMLQANGIKKVKMFDADPWTLQAFEGTNIQVMVAIPNDQLNRMTDYSNAQQWVAKNITAHNGKVDIRYVAVGNEPFLSSYDGRFTNDTFPAVKNIQRAFNEAGVGNTIKAVIPLNADVYDSPGKNPVPSAGNFRKDIRRLMVDIVRFLRSNGAPFVVNIYPFLSLYQSSGFPFDYAFFDQGSLTVQDKGKTYHNVFDANYDTLVWALKKAGVPDMKVVIGEAGWPTDGDEYANAKLAQRFYDGFLMKLGKNEGTPMRPGPMEAYLFELFDEDLKSIAPGPFERHWGILTYDGKPKFQMDLDGQGHDKTLVAVQGVQYLPSRWCVLKGGHKTDDEKVLGAFSYSCLHGDCSEIGPGASCSGLSPAGYISYGFNNYFQINDQDVRACDFHGVAEITKRNPSVGTCDFIVQIQSSGRRAAASLQVAAVLVALVLA